MSIQDHVGDKTGGSAFSQHNTAPHNGMTLRDWFAGQVLAGMAVRGERITQPVAAEIAYGTADAMIAERSKP